MNKTYLAIAAVAAISLPVFAEYKLDDEIIVTATKVEQPLKATLPTAHVMTALDIERFQPRDLPSLLGRISGVSYRDSGGRGSTSGVFIRGATPSQAVVLIDGVRSSSATTGATALENIPVAAIERIEVVKGPLSGLYGADAMGGVIQVFTKRGQSSDFGGGLRLNYGSHRLRDYGFSISGGNEKHQFFAAVSKEDTDGIDRTDLKILGNGDRDGFEETSGNLSAAFTLSDSMKAQFNYVKSNGRSEFDNAYGADLGRYSDTEMESIGTKLLYSPNQTVQVSLDLGYFGDHLVTPVFSSDIHTRRHSAALQTDIRLDGVGILTLGVDYYSDDVSTLNAFAETARDNKGYFVQWQGNLGRVSVASSLRHDDNEAYGNDINGSFSLAYSLGLNVQLVVSLGTAFKAPTFNELYYPGYGNLDILPEESETFELALRGSQASVDWRISIYQSDIDNLISGYPASNIKSAILKGVELEVNTSAYGWDLSASIDYLDARDDDTNEYLDDRAVLSGNLNLGRRYRNLYVGVDVQAEHGRHDSTGIKLDGFSLWGVSAIYELTESLRFSARIDNLLDEEYTLNYARNSATSSVFYMTEGTVVKLGMDYSF